MGGLNDKTFIHDTTYIHMIRPIKVYEPFSISFLYRYRTCWENFVIKSRPSIGIVVLGNKGGIYPPLETN